MKVFILYLKKYWVIALTVVLAIVFFVFNRRKLNSTFENMGKLKKSYEIEIAAINSAREKERAAYEKSQKDYEDLLKQVRAEYETRNIELEKKKEKEIKLTYEKYKDDPEELAIVMSEVTGFKIWTAE